MIGSTVFKQTARYECSVHIIGCWWPKFDWVEKLQPNFGGVSCLSIPVKWYPRINSWRYGLATYIPFELYLSP